MKKIRDARGMTLIEILAAIVILSLGAAMVSSIIFSSTREQVEQTNTNQNIKDVSYALKVITKDFRKAKNLSSTGMTLNYYLTEAQQNDLSLARSVSYELEDQNLLKTLKDAQGISIGSETIATNIAHFLICEYPIDTTTITCSQNNDNNNQLYYIYISSETGQSIQTEITLRSGS